MGAIGTTVQVLAVSALVAPVLVVSGAAVAADPACGAPAPITYEMDYIDTARAGGEPIITRHPDGQLLWGSHAGTTHFYSPTADDPATAAFIQNYEGQTYYYVSEEEGSWDFVPRAPLQAALATQVPPSTGLPATGFSDPEFAIDAAGNVFVSEINLANIAVSKSTDGGRSYDLVNAVAFTSSDRQWMAADREDELYMAANGFGGGSFPADAVGNLGHFIAKSTDGGLTWGAASTTNPDGTGDIQIDQERGILYELSESGGSLRMARFPDIREESSDFTVEEFPITNQASIVSQIDPTFDMDAAGNLYVTWPHNPSGDQDAQGIYYAYSTDRGETWSDAVRVDTSVEDDVWPWIAVGAPGQVAITWLQSSQATGAARGGEAGGTSAEWSVMVAHTDTGLGCGDGTPPQFTAVTASAEPVHTGTICQHGTTCQADLTDRRLGDYHSVEVAGDGTVHVAVSDTRQGGAVALPLEVRQVGGPTLGDPTSTVVAEASPTGNVVTATVTGLKDDPGRSSSTVVGALALAALVVAAVTRRRTTD